MNAKTSALLAFLALACFAGAAHAQGPTLAGTWSGKFSDGSGSMAVVIISDASGAYATFDARGRRLLGASGYWSLQPTSAGGVLTMHYMHVFPAKTYFSITVLGADRLKLVDPVGKVGLVLHQR
ncbi:MAG: hypothetical protein K2W96_13830 [Gemmataceae bacterium]|nr:hypothetical protein [Gemmataceae bacterium]